jgi:low affinity Fe/Cu permease
VPKPKGKFDQIAEFVSRQISRGWFFVLCLVLVLGWLVLLPIQGWDNELWHLALNSPTTAITFLMVAVLQNSTQRFEDATNKKLNAIAEGLADLLEEFEGTHQDIEELRKAAGIEREIGA